MDLKDYTQKLDKITNLLEEMNERSRKRRQAQANKERGYSPRCSICTHPELDLIEELREERGYTYEEIKEELGLDCSIMALSRHFKNHFPQKARYRLKREQAALEELKLQLNLFPFLKDYFDVKPLEELERFIYKDGFCVDCFKCCKFINAGAVATVEDFQKELTNKIFNEMGEDYFGRPGTNTVKDLIIMFNCQKCYNNNLAERTNLLEVLLINKVFNIDVSPTELLFTLRTQYNNNVELLLEDLATTPPKL